MPKKGIKQKKPAQARQKLELTFVSPSSARAAAAVLRSQMEQIPKSGAQISTDGNQVIVSCSSPAARLCAERLGSLLGRLQSA